MNNIFPGLLAACLMMTAADSTRASMCQSDLDGNGNVNAADLAILLGMWGPSRNAPADLTGDGVIDAADLAVLLGAWNKFCDNDITSVQLAGMPLEQYPHVDFVQTFNEGSVVHVAIDPTLHPQLAELTVDVYIVQAKTEAQWQADGSLMDVADGPQEIQVGRSVAASILPLAGSTDLPSSSRGMMIGAAYDVVIDVNGNGQLDDGDLIDGRSGEAGFYVVPDLVAPGPFEIAIHDYPFIPPNMSKVATGLTSPVAGEESTGACCVNNFCAELFESSCRSIGGVWQGAGVICQDAPCFTPPEQFQRLMYPVDIASIGPRPLVVISHGAGHQYDWYDYLQTHLASHGYVVMSHTNLFQGPDVLPSVLPHLDGFLHNLDTIANGQLLGLVDSDTIVLIGHSVGGRDILRGYDRLVDGTTAPETFGAQDIALLSCIAANSEDGPDIGTPHGAVFHVLYGSADGDISGAVWCESCQPFRHLDRGTGPKQSTYIHGADHNDFNCCGFPNFQGPPDSELGPDIVQDITKAEYLALLQYYIDANPATRDFLWRQWEVFRPIGVDPDTTVVKTYTPGPISPRYVVDDFQANEDIATSSSGGAVTWTVAHVVEDRLDDGNSTFAWTELDPMNGMTHAGFLDLSRGLVFDWSSKSGGFLAFEIPVDGRDITEYSYVSFRACQGTRHPLTLAEDGDLTFTVKLIDGRGATSSINIGAYGGGIEETYRRQQGWQNEFETIRIRLTDFLADGTSIDLSDVAAIQFEFGTPFGSAQGRLGLDDIQFTN